MSREIGVEMDRVEIESFLKAHGLGVLGFAKGGESYTIPLAFAYDETRDRCIFRFVMTAESTTREFISQTDIASLTVYDWQRKNDWKSVVARGPVQQIGNDELGQAAALFSDVGDETALDVFNRPISEYETQWYEMNITELTGRGQFPGLKDRE